jgi:hypothetical protein
MAVRARARRPTHPPPPTPTHASSVGPHGKGQTRATCDGNEHAGRGGRHGERGAEHCDIQLKRKETRRRAAVHGPQGESSCGAWPTGGVVCSKEAHVVALAVCVRVRRGMTPWQDPLIPFCLSISPFPSDRRRIGNEPFWPRSMEALREKRR